MNTSWRRRALFLTIWLLSATLSFVLLQSVLDDDNNDGRDRRPPMVSPGSPASVGTMSGTSGGVELTVTLTDIYDEAATFMVPERQARAVPPPHVQDCRQFASWAYRNGAIPVGAEPGHLLTMRAGHIADVVIESIEAVPIAEVLIEPEQGPWVSLSCREASSARTSAPNYGTDDGWYRLLPGHEVRVPVELEGRGGEPPFPSGVWEYYLRVHLLVDGVEQVRELRDEEGRNFRCCGRTTFMGFLAAQYEWTLSPTRTLRYCAEQRWVHEPPPLVCHTTIPG